MTASELRIGNLVYYHIEDLMDERKEWDEVSPIDHDDIRCLVQYEDNSEYRPIPLTEEWLLKFGFYKRKACGNYWFEKSYKKLLFLTNDINPEKGLAFSTKLNHVFIHDLNWQKRVKYVHSLQNLYFVLTGNELKLNHESIKSNLQRNHLG